MALAVRLLLLRFLSYLSSRQFYDNEGRLAYELDAENGLAKSSYNLFGERTMLSRQMDATRSIVTNYAYDKLGRVARSWMDNVETFNVQNVDAGDGMVTNWQATYETHGQAYTYDELGRRIATTAIFPGQTDVVTTRTRYDLDGNVVGTRDEAGVIMRYAYDAYHRKVMERDANGMSMDWDYDQKSGELLTHTDLGKATMRYSYDGLHQLVAQTSSARGSAGLSQNLVFTYDAGLLTRIDDLTTRQVTTYAYDVLGNRVREKTVLLGTPGTPPVNPPPVDPPPVNPPPVDPPPVNPPPIDPPPIDPPPVVPPVDAFPTGADAQNIAGLYFCLLGHGPDLASLNLYIDALAQPGQTRMGVADLIMHNADCTAQQLSSMTNEDFLDTVWGNTHLNQMGSVQRTYYLNTLNTDVDRWKFAVGAMVDSLSDSALVAFNTRIYAALHPDLGPPPVWVRPLPPSPEDPRYPPTHPVEIESGASVAYVTAYWGYYRTTFPTSAAASAPASAPITAAATSGTSTVSNVVLSMAATSSTPVVPDVVLQNNYIKYDQQGRMVRVLDDRFKVIFEYDKNGNRVSVNTQYMGATAGKVFNTYDKMNRQLVVNGVNAGTDASPNYASGSLGHVLTYDLAGNRLSDTHFNNTVTENYTYDDAGRLKNTLREGTVIDMRKYDSAGRLSQSGAETLSLSPLVRASPGRDDYKHQLESWGLDTVYRTFSYDLAGKVLRQKERDVVDGARNDMYYSPSAAHSPFYLSQAGYDAAGHLKGYWLVPPGSAADAQVLYTTEYTYFDSYAQSTLTAKIESGVQHVTTSTYDQNGNLIRVSEPMANYAGMVKDRTFGNDASGHVLTATSDGKVMHALVVNGEMLGSDGNSDLGLFADNYEPVGTAVAAGAPSVYIVKANDETLQGIATAVWGDAKLWYLIADANGISGIGLTAGMALQIPQRVATVHNDYQTYKPYDPSALVGDLTPTMPIPAADKGCGTMGIVLVIVVAIVVTILSQGVLEKPMEALVGATVAPALTAATSAAIGSAVSQGVAVGIGVQKEFSWKAVGMAALSAGITKGLVPGASGAGGLGVGTIRQMALASALTQGIGVALGLQDHFQWRGVAASFVGSVVGQGIASEAGSTAFGQTLGGFTGRFVGALAGGYATAAVRGGKISMTQVVTDAFGNALGESIAAGMQSKSSLPDSLWNREGGSNPTSAPLPFDQAAMDRDVLDQIENGERYASLGDDPRRSVLRLSAGAPDGNMKPSDVYSFVDKYTDAHPNASTDEVQTAYDRSKLTEPQLRAEAEGRGPLTAAAAAGEGVSFSSLGTNFVKGIGDVAYGLTVGTALNVLDLGTAFSSIAWNELGARSAYNWATNKNEPEWYGDLHGPTAAGYLAGTSQLELALANTPFGIGYTTYHMTTSGMDGDWNGVSRQSGSVVGGFAVGAGVKRYGGYGVDFAEMPPAGARGRQYGNSVGLKIVPPKDVAATASAAGSNAGRAKPLAEWLAGDDALLAEMRRLHEEQPQWQGIHPDTTPVFYRTKAEVDLIRAQTGESGGHHPHGLALGGPLGQKLTPTGETRTVKNPLHSQATALQRRIINNIKNQPDGN